MDIEFASSRMRKRCESERALQRAYGGACARKAMARLADLDAATSLADLRGLPGCCREVPGAPGSQVAIDLADGKQLVIEPACEPVALDDAGELDWKLIDAVLVIDIANYDAG